jgi:hypothetical protein
VDVIRHEAKVVTTTGKELLKAGQSGQVAVIVSVILKDRLAIMASGDGVVETS